MAETPAFATKNLVKHFGEVKALQGVTLEAKAGTVFGLLGPNGAGKTTIVRALSTLLDPTSGSAQVLGHDVVHEAQTVRQLIGLAGQYAALDEYQTGFENVFMTGRLYGLSRKQSRARTKDLLDRLGLSDAADRQVKTYSGGMRRRLDLGASLVGEPRVLFLDEPTTGLDPQTRLDLWAIIRDLIAGGTSILLTTQYLEEADELADMIAVVDNGKVIAQGTSNQLKAKLGGDVIEFSLVNRGQAEKALQLLKPLANQTPSFDEATLQVRVPVADGSKGLMAVVQALSRAKLEVESLSLHRPSLDDVFLTLTGSRAESKTATKPKARQM